MKDLNTAMSPILDSTGLGRVGRIEKSTGEKEVESDKQKLLTSNLFLGTMCVND